VRAQAGGKGLARTRETGVASAVAERAEAPWSPRSPVFIGLSAVAMSVPLAVDGRAAGAYDDPKAWALPMLVGATVLAWTAGPASRPPEDGPARVLRFTVLLSLAWALITSVTSIAPIQSVVGSFGRGMGLLIVSSAMMLFFVVRSECRTPDAVRALIDAALLGSAPVCVMGLGQAVGWDPLPRSWDPAVAKLIVRSTFGQHIFLGSYLVILVPLAAARLDWAWRRWRASGPPETLRPLLTGALWIVGVPILVELASRWPPAWWALVPWGVAGAIAWAFAGKPGGQGSQGLLEVALLAALLCAQVLVVVLSAARGPFLGMVFGVSAAGLALFARRRARAALVVTASAVAAILFLLVLLNVPGSPLAGFRRVKVLHRLSRIADVRRGTPVWFRIEVWGGIVSGWARQVRGEEVIPDTRPWVRSALGYGLETQLLTLDQLSLPRIHAFARGDRWRGKYLVDRAHNAFLDKLVTEGMVGAVLWLTAVGSLLVVGSRRVRTASTADETSMRLGCLGAVLAHLVEGQVGIVTTMPLALFWMVAGVLATPPWAGGAARLAAVPQASSERRSLRKLALVPLALAVLFIAWVGTRWLLASTAYADGARQSIAGRLGEAAARFQRARELMPWLSLPAEAFAYTALVLAGRESDPIRRLEMLHEGEAALAETRRYARGSASSWGFTAQIALAEARAGERDKLPISMEAFAKAAALRPRDASIMAEWGLAWLESGEPAKALEAAEKALSLPRGRGQWRAWLVLSLASREMGDVSRSAHAADQARRLAPAGAQRALEGLPSGERGP
jgi:hypothetical protein